MNPGLYHGDCRDLIKQVPDGTVQVAVADPPYNIDYDYDGEFEDNLPKTKYIEWSRDWMSALLPKLKPGGSFWLMISDEYAAELKVEAEKLGFKLRSWCIWFFTFGVHCQDKFTRSHQHIFWFGVGDARPDFYRENVLVPSARQARYNDKRAAAGGRTPNDTWILFPDQLPASAGDPELDVWLESRIAGTFKRRVEEAANQLPERLVSRMVLSTSKEGDLVLDPFAGTGTIPVVAKKLKRSGIGFEQSKKVFQRAHDRYEAAQPGDELT